MMNQGMISEYFDIVREALKIELDREPSHQEIMEIVYSIISNHIKRE
jgi:hypothetical protein